jgi:hypothetical protein
LQKKQLGIISTDKDTAFYLEPLKRKRSNNMENVLAENIPLSLMPYSGTNTNLDVQTMLDDDSWIDSVGSEPSKKDGKTFFELYPETNLQFYKKLILEPIKNNLEDPKVWCRYDESITDSSENVMENSINFGWNEKDDSYLPVLGYADVSVNYMNSAPLFWIFDNDEGIITLFGTNIPIKIEAYPTARTQANSIYFSFFKYVGDFGFNNTKITNSLTIDKAGFSFNKSNIEIEQNNNNLLEVREIKETETTTVDVSSAVQKWNKEIDAYDFKSNAMCLDPSTNPTSVIVSNTKIDSEVFNKGDIPDITKISKGYFIWHSSLSPLDDDNPYVFGISGNLLLAKLIPYNYHNPYDSQKLALNFKFNNDGSNDYIQISSSDVSFNSSIIRSELLNLDSSNNNLPLIFDTIGSVLINKPSDIYFKKDFNSNSNSPDASFNDIVKYVDNNYFYYTIYKPHAKVSHNGSDYEHFYAMGGYGGDAIFGLRQFGYNPLYNAATDISDVKFSYYKFTIKVPINWVPGFEKIPQILHFNTNTIDYINTYISKYDLNGNLIKQINPSLALGYKSLVIEDIITDDNKNIYAGGYTYSDISGTNVNPQYSDLFILKYDENLSLVNKFQLISDQFETYSSSYDLSNNEHNVRLKHKDNRIVFSFNSSSDLSNNELVNGTITDGIYTFDISDSLIIDSGSIFDGINFKKDICNNVIQDMQFNGNKPYILVHNIDSVKPIIMYEQSGNDAIEEFTLGNDARDKLNSFIVSSDVFFMVGTFYSNATDTSIISTGNAGAQSENAETGVKSNVSNSINTINKALILTRKVDGTIFYNGFVYTPTDDGTVERAEYTDLTLNSTNDKIFVCGYKRVDGRNYPIVHQYNKQGSMIDVDNGIINKYESDEYFDTEFYKIKVDDSDNIYIYGSKKDLQADSDNVGKLNTFLFKMKFENVTNTTSIVKSKLVHTDLSGTELKTTKKEAKSVEVSEVLETFKTEWSQMQNNMNNSGFTAEAIDVDLKYKNGDDNSVMGIYKNNEGICMIGDEGNINLVPHVDKYTFKYPLMSTITSKQEKLKFKFQNVYYEDGKTQFQIISDKGSLIVEWSSGSTKPFLALDSYMYCLVEDYKPHTFYTEHEIYGKEVNIQEYEYITDYNVSDFYKNKRIIEYEIKKPYTLVRYPPNINPIKAYKSPFMLDETYNNYLGHRYVNGDFSDIYYKETNNSFIVRVAIDKNIPYIPKFHDLFKNYKMYVDGAVDSQNNVYTAMLRSLGSAKLFCMATEPDSYEQKGYHELGYSYYTWDDGDTRNYKPAGINVKNLSGTNLGRLAIISNVNSMIKNLSFNGITDSFTKKKPVFTNPFKNVKLEYLSGSDPIEFKIHTDEGSFVVADSGWASTADSSNNNTLNNTDAGNRLYLTKIKSLATIFKIANTDTDIIKTPNYVNQTIVYDLSGVYYTNNSNSDKYPRWPFFVTDQVNSYADDTVSRGKSLKLEVPWDFSNNAINIFGINSNEFPSFLDYLQMQNKELQTINIRKYNSQGVLQQNKYIDLSGNICNGIKMICNGNDNVDVAISGKKSIRDISYIDLKNNVLDYNSEVHIFRMDKSVFDDDDVILSTDSDISYIKHEWDQTNSLYHNKYILHIEGEMARSNNGGDDWDINSSGPFDSTTSPNFAKNYLHPNGELRVVLDGSSSLVIDTSGNSGYTYEISHNLLTAIPRIRYYNDSWQEIAEFNTTDNNRFKNNINTAILNARPADISYNVSTSFYNLFEDYYSFDVASNSNTVFSDTHSGIDISGDAANEVIIWRQNYVSGDASNPFEVGGFAWKFHQNTVESNINNSVLFKKRYQIDISGARLTPEKFYITNTLYPVYEIAGSYGVDDPFKIKLISISQDIGETTLTDIASVNNDLYILGSKNCKYNTHNKPITESKGFVLKVNGSTNALTKYDLPMTDVVNNGNTRIDNYPMSMALSANNKLYISGIKQHFGHNYTKYRLFKGQIQTSGLDEKLIQNAPLNNIFEYAYHNNWNFVSIYHGGVDFTKTYDSKNIIPSAYINFIDLRTRLGLSLDTDLGIDYPTVDELGNNVELKYIGNGLKFTSNGLKFNNAGYLKITKAVNVNGGQTYEAYIQPIQYALTGSLWETIFDNGSGSPQMGIYYQNNGYDVVIEGATYSNGVARIHAYNFSHIVWTFSSKKDFKVYVNGVYQTSGEITNTQYDFEDTASGYIYVGSRPNIPTLAQSFEGTINYVKYYDRELSESEISNKVLKARFPIQTAILYRHINAKYPTKQISENAWVFNNSRIWNLNDSDVTITSNNDQVWETYFLGFNDPNIKNQGNSDMDLGLEINKNLYLEKYDITSADAANFTKEWEWETEYKNDKVSGIENTGLIIDSNSDAYLIGTTKNTDMMFGNYNTKQINETSVFPKSDKNKSYGDDSLYIGGDVADENNTIFELMGKYSLDKYDNFMNVEVGDYVYIYLADGTLVAKIKITLIEIPVQYPKYKYLYYSNGSNDLSFFFHTGSIFQFRNKYVSTGVYQGLRNAIEHRSEEGTGIWDDNIFIKDIYGNESVPNDAANAYFYYNYNWLNGNSNIPSSGGTRWFATVKSIYTATVTTIPKQIRGYLTKINSDGTYNKTTTWYNGHYTYPTDLIMDASKNIYVSGYKNDSELLYNEFPNAKLTNSYVINKFDISGNLHNTWFDNTNNNSFNTSILKDGSGNLLISGINYSIDNSGNSDVFIKQLDKQNVTSNKNEYVLSDISINTSVKWNMNLDRDNNLKILSYDASSNKLYNNLIMGVDGKTEIAGMKITRYDDTMTLVKKGTMTYTTKTEKTYEQFEKSEFTKLSETKNSIMKIDHSDNIIYVFEIDRNIIKDYFPDVDSVKSISSAVVILKYDNAGKEIWRNLIFPHSTYTKFELKETIDIDDENNIYIGILGKNPNISIQVIKISSDNSDTLKTEIADSGSTITHYGRWKWIKEVFAGTTSNDNMQNINNLVWMNGYLYTSMVDNLQNIIYKIDASGNGGNPISIQVYDDQRFSKLYIDKDKQDNLLIYGKSKIQTYDTPLNHYVERWNSDSSANSVSYSSYYDDDYVRDIHAITTDISKNVYIVYEYANDLGVVANLMGVMKLDSDLNVVWSYRDIQFNTYFVDFKATNILLDSKNNIYIYGHNKISKKATILKMNNNGQFLSEHIVDTINYDKEYEHDPIVIANNIFVTTKKAMDIDSNDNISVLIKKPGEPDFVNNHKYTNLKPNSAIIDAGLFGGTGLNADAVIWTGSVYPYNIGINGAGQPAWGGSNLTIYGSGINQLIQTTTPYGFTDVIWETTQSGSGSGAGIYNTTSTLGVVAVATKLYRFSVWIKMIEAGSDIYFGLHANGSFNTTIQVIGHTSLLDAYGNGSNHGYLFYLNNSGGSSFVNKYKNQWLLFVSYIHPYNWAPTGGLPGEKTFGDVYDVYGNSITSEMGSDFIGSNQTYSSGFAYGDMTFITSNPSNFQMSLDIFTVYSSGYSGIRDDKTYIYNPRIEDVGLGNFSIDDLLPKHETISKLVKYPFVITKVDVGTTTVPIQKIEKQSNLDSTYALKEKWNLNVNDQNNLQLSITEKVSNTQDLNNDLLTIDKNGNTIIKGEITGKQLNLTTKWKKRIGLYPTNKLTNITVDYEGNVYAIHTTNDNSNLLLHKYSEVNFRSPYRYYNDEYYNGFNVSNIKQSPYYSAIIKYNKEGKLLWSKLTPITEFNDLAEFVIHDISNNVYVIGTTTGDITGEIVDKYNANKNIFIVKYDTNGNQIWSTQLKQNNNLTLTFDEIITSCKTDNKGNLFVSLYQKIENDRYQSVILKYTHDGKLDNYLILKDNTYDLIVRSLGFDDLGNVFIMGDLGKIMVIYKYTNYLKYISKTYIPDLSGNTTVLSNPISGKELVFDNENNFYVIGTVTENITKDIFVGKYNTSLTQIWSKTVGDINIDEKGMKICCDHEDNVYIGGLTTGNTLSEHSYGHENFYYDMMIIKYDKYGIEKDNWKKQIGTKISSEGFTGLTTDPYGDLYVAGYGEGDVVGYEQHTSLYGTTDTENGFIMKYTSKNGDEAETKDWNVKINECDQMVISYDAEDNENSEITIDKGNNMLLNSARSFADEIKLIGLYFNDHRDRSGYEHHGAIKDNSTNTIDHTINYLSYMNMGNGAPANRKHLQLNKSGIFNVMNKKQFSVSMNVKVSPQGDVGSSSNGWFGFLYFGNSSISDNDADGIQISGSSYLSDNINYFLLSANLIKQNDGDKIIISKKYDFGLTEHTLKFNKWFNLTITFNLNEAKIANILKIFVDKKEITTIRDDRLGITTADQKQDMFTNVLLKDFENKVNDFHVGHAAHINYENNSPQTRNTNVCINNVMVFNKILSENEIEDIYKSNRLKYWIHPYYKNIAETSAFGRKNVKYEFIADEFSLEYKQSPDVTTNALWDDKGILRSKISFRDISNNGVYNKIDLSVNGIHKDIFSNEFVVFMKVQINLNERVDLSGALVGTGNRNPIFYLCDGSGNNYTAISLFNEMGSQTNRINDDGEIRFDIFREYQNNEYLSDAVNINFDENPSFIHNGFIDCYFIIRFLDDKVGYTVYDRKGKNKFDVGYNKLHNVDGANERQLNNNHKIPDNVLTDGIYKHVIDPIVSFGNPPSRSNPMGTSFTSNFGNKGLNGFMSNIMVFSTDLKEEEIKYLIHQPDYNRINEDLVFNNIRYKSPIPGFKWVDRIPEPKKIDENKHSNYNSGNKKLEISSKVRSELKLSSETLNYPTWSNLVVMETNDTPYRGMGVITYSEKTGDRMFYGNNYNDTNMAFNIGFDTVSKDGLYDVMANNVFSVRQNENSYGKWYGVGIGTNNIQSKLHVDGWDNVGLAQVRFQGSSTYGTYIQVAHKNSNYYSLAVFNEDGDASPILYCRADGNVGIGTKSPGYPLEINGSNTDNVSSSGYQIYDTGAGTFTSISNTDISLKTSRNIWSGGAVFATSDQRIKENIAEVPDNLSLQTLRDINCTYYEYKDKISKGNDKTIGFIAQQVKEHMPMAVSMEKSIIPNEMRKIENPVWTPITENGETKYKLTISDLSDNVGDTKYRFYVSNDPSGNDEVQKEIKSLEDDPKSFVFDQSWNNVFLYGKEVDDLNILDKNKLFALNFSATQEIDRIQQAAEAKITALQNENAELKTKNTELENKYNALEARIAALEN